MTEERNHTLAQLNRVIDADLTAYAKPSATPSSRP